MAMDAVPIDPYEPLADLVTAGVTACGSYRKLARVCVDPILGEALNHNIVNRIARRHPVDLSPRVMRQISTGLAYVLDIHPMRVVAAIQRDLMRLNVVWDGRALVPPDDATGVDLWLGEQLPEGYEVVSSRDDGDNTPLPLNQAVVAREVAAMEERARNRQPKS